MEHQALHDSLTSLPNRVLLKDRVEQVIGSRSHADESCVLALIDLDRFKEINDTFGHHAGDDVLKQSATRIAGLLRKSDTVARLGGDEFALLLTDTKIPEAIAVVERIVQEITRSFECEGHSISLGASVGLAGYPEDGENHEQLLKRADIAMYSAKSSGGGVKAYTPVMDEDYITGLTLISDLRMALEQGQFFAVYQPKMDIQTGELSGVESLIRWMHPQRGLVHPNDFIPLAERSGLIFQMTQWVLRESIRQVADWMKKGMQIPVAVNLSPKNLIEDGLHEAILGFLKEFDVPAKLLALEITENSVIDDPLRATEILNRLHDVGIEIAIDDFGTGNSSLAQLRRMPVSVIKVDQSFVQHMMKNTSDATIVKATINMAHDLGLKVVAEGVEDTRTLRQLRDLGCDIAQGFLLAKPMPASDFEAWLTNLSDKDGHALTKDMWRKEHSLKQRFAALLRQQT
jgi:diguanylate cyclase (GGDEF)-like protein